MARHSHTVTLAFGLALAFPGTAAAQYRADEPAVLARPAPPPDPAIGVLARFRAAYARARTPRIVVFWNREFDDEVASEYEDRQTEREVESTTGNGLETITQGPAGQATRHEDSQLRDRMKETVSGTHRVRPAPRGHAGTQAVDWQIEIAFNTALASAGVQLVDRRMVMRLSGVAMGADARANVQAIETRGLAHFADVVIEVLQSQDGRAPGGVSFRITARALNRAQTLANLVSSGQPHRGPMPLVAGPNGFERASAPAPGPSQVGSELALETLASLSQGL